MSEPKRQSVSPQVTEIIRRIYIKSAVGCCWHVVLDDENWDLIDFCREQSAERCLPTAQYACQTEGACQELAALDVTASILKRAMREVDAEIRADNFKCGTDYAARKFAPFQRAK